MYKLKPYSVVAALALAGCASSRTEPVPTAAANEDTTAPATAAPSAPAASSAPAKVVDMATLESDRVRCQDLTRPGTRIVVARRCTPIDEEALAETLNQVRRDQETLDRLARERENQRRGAF